jgi:hypothetical protein
MVKMERQELNDSGSLLVIKNDHKQVGLVFTQIRQSYNDSLPDLVALGLACNM